MSISLSDKTIEFLKNTCIFCQPWWLDAVSGGRWDVAVVERAGEVMAALPYAYKIRLGKLRLIEMPPLTPYLGPWLCSLEGKYAGRLGKEKRLMTELIDRLPQFAVFNQEFHPAITSWLPFYWKGFQQTTVYTYIIEGSRKPDDVWSATEGNIRWDIRKAERQVEVVDEPDAVRFLGLHRLTFKRQGKQLPYPEGLFYRLDAECAKRQARKMLFAMDSHGRAHAGLYLVWDAKMVYYLLGAGDPKLRNSGAASLLIWHGIKFALSQGKGFDFEGSMVEGIEQFFRGFGPRQVPYFKISKMDSPAVYLYRALCKQVHRLKK